jgi:hypothetical protein
MSVQDEPEGTTKQAPFVCGAISKVFIGNTDREGGPLLVVKKGGSTISW